MAKNRKLAGFEDVLKESYESNNLTYAELAKVYGVSEGTVRRALIRAGAVKRGPGRRPNSMVVKEFNHGVQ